ncbi:MAG: hypothetical protein JXB35_13455 [Anaerolineae bacterium]|nr:hypothetical protein [Anaerolineae bacterium]
MGIFKNLFGKKKTQQPAELPERKPAAVVKPDFPLGDNIISDPDIRRFEDLGRCYPLPAGFDYRCDEGGVPFIMRLADEKRFSFLIEAGLLTFDDPYLRPGGKPAYKTTEVFKQAP